MFSSDEIINGIKVNDKKIWEFLYKYYYPAAKKYVINNSGTDDDVNDLLQNTFIKILLKCREGYHHDNIQAVIAKRLKWDWIDKIRSEQYIIKSEITENTLITHTQPDEFITPLAIRTNLKRRVNLSLSIRKQLKKTCKIEDFLDYNNLNSIQKRMIEILLDEDRTNPICKKLLILTHFLPIEDNNTIADEMGYIMENTEAGRKKGLDTLSTQKSRCLRRFQQYFS